MKCSRIHSQIFPFAETGEPFGLPMRILVDESDAEVKTRALGSRLTRRVELFNVQYLYSPVANPRSFGDLPISKVPVPASVRCTGPFGLFGRGRNISARPSSEQVEQNVFTEQIPA